MKPLKEVVAEFPHLFEGRNHHCGDGWGGIIHSLCAKLDFIHKVTGIDIKCVQVKEKFGTLRFYLGPLQSEWFDIIHALVNKAERQSSYTCEITGEYGEARPLLGWVKTLSDGEYLKALKKKGFDSEEAAARDYVDNLIKDEEEVDNILRGLVLSNVYPVQKEALRRLEHLRSIEHVD